MQTIKISNERVEEISSQIFGLMKQEKCSVSELNRLSLILEIGSHKDGRISKPVFPQGGTSSGRKIFLTVWPLVSMPRFPPWKAD